MTPWRPFGSLCVERIGIGIECGAVIDRMKLLSFGTFFAAAVCAGGTLALAAESADQRFGKLAAEFTETHYAQRPLAGLALGWHRYDGQFVVPDRASLDAELARLRRFDAAFGAFPPDTLSSGHRNDLRLIRSTIGYERWLRERVRVFERNPMAYGGDHFSAQSLDISGYLKRDFKPLPLRIADIAAILRKAPVYLEVARANLEPVLPKPFIEVAITAAEGSATFIERDVTKVAASLEDAGIRRAFDEAARPAVAAFRAYADWLRRERLPGADASFPLGREGYVEMLKVEGIELPPERLLAVGEAALQAEQKRFVEAARAIDRSASPEEIARRIGREHPTAANLIPDTRRNLEAIRRFLVDKRIVTVPRELHLKVEETLPPFRATSFASMDTPGPFESKAGEAYYYITPVEPDWTAQQAEEWLSAFDYYGLDVTSMHEAYPGHYLQALAANRAPLSTVAQVFPSNPYAAVSYAFNEGWAHYSELMMIEQGFGQPANPATATAEETLRGAKYRLAQSRESLLRLCRFCCSVRMHTQGMTLAEATTFFRENAHLEEKPAASEATRGTYDPGYLHYSLGKLMILKLREDWKAQEGSRYSLRRFHDEFLRHGAPPIPLLRELMLRDRSQWSRIL